MPTHRVVKLDELSQYFHMPEKQVARQLGVCLTSLKKICRQNGITRWPYRKLKSLDKKINKIENALTSSAEDPSAMLMKWEMLKLEKKNLPFSGNPGDESDAETRKRSPVENTGSTRASAMTTPSASPPHESEWSNGHSASASGQTHAAASSAAGSVVSAGARSFHSLLERKLRNVGSVSAHREALALRGAEDSVKQQQQQQQQQQQEKQTAPPKQSRPQAVQARPSALALDTEEADLPVPLDAIMSDEERARFVDLYCNPPLSGKSVSEFRLPDMLSPANAANGGQEDLFDEFSFPEDDVDVEDAFASTEEFMVTA